MNDCHFGYITKSLKETMIQSLLSKDKEQLKVEANKIKFPGKNVPNSSDKKVVLKKSKQTIFCIWPHIRKLLLG